jgi:hypothetical protein
MLHIGYVVCLANSYSFWEPLILLNVSMDIEDVHVPRILIFINILENYRLNLLNFKKWKYNVLAHHKKIWTWWNPSQERKLMMYEIYTLHNDWILIPFSTYTASYSHILLRSSHRFLHHEHMSCSLIRESFKWENSALSLSNLYSCPHYCKLVWFIEKK